MASRSLIAKPPLRIGCAGWSIPAAHAAAFPPGDSQLERYARVFDCVEINSSFHRPHQPATWRRWAAAVPAHFRFSVKMPKTISHAARLRDCANEVDAFLAQAGELGERLGCLLLQLPPSLAWRRATVLPFLEHLRRAHAGPVACEPRHTSWFSGEASRTLREFAIARVAADPARAPRAALPAGDRRWAYLRLHGSPRMYYDAYAPAVIDGLAARLQRWRAAGAECWCIFDNTAHGHAAGDAMALQRRLRPRRKARARSESR